MQKANNEATFILSIKLIPIWNIMQSLIRNILRSFSASLCLLAFLLINSFSVSAQEIIIWPGDANNNGVVNHVDLLNVGLAYNKTGSERTPIDAFIIIAAGDLPNEASLIWDFGDGERTNDLVATHKYEQDGNYTISLIVFVQGQAQCLIQTEITVGDSNLFCDLTLLPDGDLTLGSTEINWTAEVNEFSPIDYLWDFGNSNQSISNPTFDYGEEGTYYTCLTVTDSTGNKCSTCTLVTVGTETPPIDSCFSNFQLLIFPTSFEWSGQSLTDPWNSTFESGLNSAYGDCDGDGLVDNFDIEAIPFNYNQTHGIINPDEFLDGVAGQDIELNLDASFIDSFNLPGSLIEIPIILGDAQNPIDDFYGMAFSIEYDSSLIKENTLQIEFIQNSWINNDNSGLLSIQQDQYSEGKIEAAISRRDQKPVKGFGQIGKLSFVIEDDIGSFFIADPEIELDVNSIKLINEKEVERAVAGNSIVVKVDEVSNTKNPNQPTLNPIKIFPNPVKDILQIEIENSQAQWLELYSSVGQKIIHKKHLGSSIQLDLNNLANGFYFLKVHTKNGVFSKKLLIQKP